MILNFSFTNYGSFRDKVIFTMEPTNSNARPENVFTAKLDDDEIRCLKSSMIYGANASGKSTLIRFINGLVQWIQCRDLQNRSLLQNADIPIYDPFKFFEKSSHANSSFEIEFISEGKEYFYEVTFGKNAVEKEKLSFRESINTDYKELYNRNGNKVKILYQDVNKLISKGLYENQLLLSKAITYFDDPLLSPAAKYISSIIVYNGASDITTKAKEQEVLQWLTYENKVKSAIISLFDAIGTNIKGIDVRINDEGKCKVFGLHDFYDGNKKVRKEALSFSKESAGSQSLLFLACYLFKALSEGVPVFVDELEANLHSLIAKILILFFNYSRSNPKNSQIIFTTHDVNLPDLCQTRKDQIWFAEKNERGISNIFPLTDFMDVPENLLFRDWYINEKFGAVPKTTSLRSLW